MAADWAAISCRTRKAAYDRELAVSTIFSPFIYAELLALLGFVDLVWVASC